MFSPEVWWRTSRVALGGAGGALAQLLHGSATTTARLRALFQSSSEPATVLARRHDVNPKTVRQWRHRTSVDDQPMGPRQRRSSTRAALEEAALVAFRVQTRLPLDDVVRALRASSPQLTRSTLHCCLERRGASSRPHQERTRRSQFKRYDIGYFRLDIAEVRTAREKAYLFIAVDRTSKLAFARIYGGATSLVAAAFLTVLARSVPYRLHTGLDGNGIRSGMLADGGCSRGAPPLRPHVPAARDRAPDAEVLPPVHERAGRADSAHAQAGDGPRVPLRPHPRVAAARRRLPDGVQLRQAAQGAPLADTRRNSRRALANEAPAVPRTTRPPHPGTEHLANMVEATADALSPPFSERLRLAVARPQAWRWPHMEHRASFSFPRVGRGP